MKKFVSLLIALVMTVAVIFGAGIITANGIPGDTNEDGAIDNKDVVTLFRYVSGTEKAEDESKYDYNKDGVVDNKDVVALFRAVSTGAVSVEETTEEETTEEETTEDLGEFVVTPDSDAELYVPRVFGDHMVIQRDEEIKVWGTSNKDGAQVRATFMGDSARAKVKDGKWEITLPAKPANAEGQTLTIEDSCGNTITFTDILVGDVWIVSGQSNAKETPTRLGLNVKGDAKMPIRIFQQDENDVINDRATAANPCEDVINPTRGWRVARTSAVLNFSALGWFFGSRLVTETGVPMGVICMAAGGASICELMPKELAYSLNYKSGVLAGPGEYYNGLMHPFLRIKFKGMLFFQGEGEGGSGSSILPSSVNYARDFEALMTELRSRFGFDFPVFNVQLCDYLGEEPDTYWTRIGEVRTQQYAAYKKMSGVWLVPSFDLGSKTTDRDGVHSPYKEALANRMANIALAELYGIGTTEPALAPEPAEITVVSTSETEKVIDIKFEHVGEGLTSISGNDTATGFVYGKNSHPYYSEKSTVAGTIVSADTVRLTVPANTTYVGYACTKRVTKDDVLLAQLYNSYNLPPLAFYLEVK